MPLVIELCAKYLMISRNEHYSYVNVLNVLFVLDIWWTELLPSICVQHLSHLGLVDT